MSTEITNPVPGPDDFRLPDGSLPPRRERVDEFTDRERAMIPHYSAAWEKWSTNTDPAPRGVVEEAIQRCYETSDLPWHGNVVWCGSIFVAAMAAPIAAAILDGRLDKRSTSSLDPAVERAVRRILEGRGDGPDPAESLTPIRHPGPEYTGTLLGATPGMREHIRDDWSRFVGGRWWVTWMASRQFFRDVCGLHAPDIDWDVSDNWVRANSADWWYPHENFCLVSDVPSFIGKQRIGPDGPTSHELHNADGPSVVWRDGFQIHHWRGVSVPAELILNPTMEWIANEPNVEMRRRAIESMGVEAFKEHLGDPIDVADDPGNPGQELELYRLDPGIWGGAANALICHNGSLERDGTRRQYLITTPAGIDTALAAVAWTYGLGSGDGEAAYRKLERRS